jgi:hypothetical protein
MQLTAKADGLMTGTTSIMAKMEPGHRGALRALILQSGESA